MASINHNGTWFSAFVSDSSVELLCDGTVVGVGAVESGKIVTSAPIPPCVVISLANLLSSHTRSIGSGISIR